MWMDHGRGAVWATFTRLLARMHDGLMGKGRGQSGAKTQDDGVVCLGMTVLYQQNDEDIHPRIPDHLSSALARVAFSVLYECKGGVFAQRGHSARCAPGWCMPMPMPMLPRLLVLCFRDTHSNWDRSSSLIPQPGLKPGAGGLGQPHPHPV